MCYHWHRAEQTRGLGIVFIQLEISGEHGIEAGDRRPDAESRTHQAIGSGANSRGRYCRAAGTGANRSSEAANAASGRVLHDSGVHTQDAGARLGAQVVSVCDVEVVARDFDIEIVLECECDRIIDGEINLAIADQRVHARRICEIRHGQFPRLVGLEKVGKGAARFGVVL